MADENSRHQRDRDGHNHPPLVVYENATIFDRTVDHPAGSVVVTSGSRILAVGEAERLAPVIGHPHERVDLAGQAIYPGFIDAHAHFVDTGLMATRLDLGPVESIVELLHAIRERSDSVGHGWVLCGNFDENFMREKRLPSMEELDDATGGLPLYINHRSYHWTLVNSEGLRRLGLPESIEGLIRDESGRPTGLLNLDANAQAKIGIAELVPDSAVTAGIAAAVRMAGEVGITTVQCIEGGAEYGGSRFVDILLGQALDTVEPVVFFNTDRPEEAFERGIRHVGGDLTVDGSLSNWTAALNDDYDDSPGNRGNLYYTASQLEHMIEFAHTRGMQIGFHAIGDRGVEMALDAFTAVLSRHPPRDHRHRIEHFGMPTATHILRARDLGLIVTVQPAFMYQKFLTYSSRVGDRWQSLYPLRSLHDAGVLIAGSSDTMVSPFDPLFGIHAAVNGPVEHERLSVRQAIDLYTLNAARAVFRENDLGAIRPGMRADFAVLDRDLRDVPVDELASVKVTRTVFRGRTVFERPSVKA